MAGSEVVLGSVKASFCATLILLISLKTISAQDIAGGGNERVAEIVKRQLRWNLNGYIVSDKGSSIKIDYLQPHIENVEVLADKDYMAFTLYMRNGNAEVPNTGVFHFINSEKADKARLSCSRKTMHAGAYYYFYKKCPEDESSVVASGYCYQGESGKGLVYNSNTFNKASMSYVDEQYYLDDNRIVHSYEQSLIQSCFNSWKNSGFKVNSWNCSTRGMPHASGFTSDSEKSISKRSSGGCTDCECTGVSGSSGFSLWNSIMFISIIYTFAHLFS